MKKINNLKILEQSIKLSSKASELEKKCKDESLAQLIREVNKQALGIPSVIAESDQGSQLEATLRSFERLNEQMASSQEESVFELARMLQEEDQMLKNLLSDNKSFKRPSRTSRLSLKDRTRKDVPLTVRSGVQGRLF